MLISDIVKTKITASDYAALLDTTDKLVEKQQIITNHLYAEYQKAEAVYRQLSNTNSEGWIDAFHQSRIAEEAYEASRSLQSTLHHKHDTDPLYYDVIREVSNAAN